MIVQVYVSQTGVLGQSGGLQGAQVLPANTILPQQPQIVAQPYPIQVRVIA